MANSPSVTRRPWWSQLLPDKDLFTADPDEFKAHSLRRIAGWQPALVDTVGLRDTSTAQALKCRSGVPVDLWEPSNIAVVGDAVHAMSPALSIGANTALRDAQTLGYQLLAAAAVVAAVVAVVVADDKPLLDGMAAYEQARRDYACHALRMSAYVGQKVFGHLPLPEQPRHCSGGAEKQRPSSCRRGRG